MIFSSSFRTPRSGDPESSVFQFIRETLDKRVPSMALALGVAAACPGLDPGAFAFAVPGSSPGQALQTQSACAGMTTLWSRTSSFETGFRKH
jgi:hypothetical protein